MGAHFINKYLFPGGVGVSLSFAISGFLIAHVMLEESASTQHISLKNFYLRRIFRLYPVIVVYVFIVLIYMALEGKLPHDYILQTLSVLFYFANYIYPHLLFEKANVLPHVHLWSASVQEHFYIVFPICFFLAARRRRLLLAIVALSCVLPLIARLIYVHGQPLGIVEQYKLVAHMETQYRIDAIGYGALLALLYHSARGQRFLTLFYHPSVLIFAAIILPINLLFPDPVFHSTWAFSIQSIVLTIVLAHILLSPRKITLFLVKVLDSAPFVWIGRRSYSLYVWHAFCDHMLEGLLPNASPFIYSPLLFGLCFVVAAMSYSFLEMPFVRLRYRFGSRDAAPAAHKGFAVAG
jgi:peptidoglycan/LPS O-acetylase OafA/YrhL